MSGDITIEILSEGRYKANLEIALSNNDLEAKSKLKKYYHPALGELLSEPKVKFEGGKVKLNSPIDPKLKGTIRGYDIEVKPSGLNHLSGSITPPTICSTLEAESRKYKYSADITFKVDVYVRPKSPPVKEPVSQEEYLEEVPVPDSKWQQLVAEVGFCMAIAKLLLEIGKGLTRPQLPLINPRIFMGPTGVSPKFKDSIYYNYNNKA